MVLIYPVCIPLILAMWVMTPTCILHYFSFIIRFAVFSQLLKSCPFYHLGFLPVWTYPWSLRVVSLLPGSFIISFAVFSQLLKPVSILYYQYDLVRDHCGAPLFLIPLYLCVLGLVLITLLNCPGVVMWAWFRETFASAGDVLAGIVRGHWCETLPPTRYTCVDVICNHDTSCPLALQSVGLKLPVAQRLCWCWCLLIDLSSNAMCVARTGYSRAWVVLLERCQPWDPRRTNSLL